MSRDLPPGVRRLESGHYQATVWLPNHDRISFSDPVLRVVVSWREEQRAALRRGDWTDPRLADHTVGQCWYRWAPTRRLEAASRKRDTSTWLNWVAPRWERTPIGSILRPDVQAWVNELEERGVGGWTIIAALNVLKSTLELAIDAGWLRANPARRVKPPVAPVHVDRVLTGEEEQRLLSRLDDVFPGRRDAGLFVAGLLETGARWEELAAVRREAVDLRAGLISLGPVMERDGTVREYPKGARSRTAAGFRQVPLTGAYLGQIRLPVMATEAGGLVFTAAEGGPMRYPTWLRRVWNVGLRVPVPDTKDDWTALLDDPQPTPHDCRHTYGTRLADAGLPEHERMALMGHKDHRSAMRYAHAGDARFDRAREAMERARRSG